MIDGIAMKGKQIIITSVLQDLILEQLHSNLMGIEKARLLARESVYWPNIDTDIDNTVKQYATCLDYQQTQPHERALPYDLPCRPWEVVGADTFMVHNKMLLCIANYYSKFPVVKKVGNLAADDIVQIAKIIFAEYGLPKMIVSDAGKFHIRNIQTVVQVDEHPAIHIIILPHNVNSDDAQYEALKIHQKSMLRIVTLKKTLLFSLWKLQ